MLPIHSSTFMRLAFGTDPFARSGFLLGHQLLTGVWQRVPAGDDMP